MTIHTTAVNPDVLNDIQASILAQQEQIQATKAMVAEAKSALQAKLDEEVAKLRDIKQQMIPYLYRQMAECAENLCSLSRELSALGNRPVGYIGNMGFSTAIQNISRHCDALNQLNGIPFENDLN